MKQLLEIVRIVTKKKVKRIEILDEASLSNRTSKFADFYEGLLAGRFRTDRDAAEALYNCSPTDDKYRQLKSRFKKRLVNTLFFIDMNRAATSDYDKALASAHKDWSLVNILLYYGASLSAASLARQVFATASRFQLSSLALESSRILRNFSAQKGKLDEFEDYDRQVKQLHPLVEAEVRCEEIVQRLMLDYDHLLRNPGPLTEQKLQSYCDALIELSERHNSANIHYNTYLVWALRYEVSKDYQGLLEVCQQAAAKMGEYPLFWTGSRIKTFQLKKMSALLHLADFNPGRYHAEQCLQDVEEGSEYWYQFLELYFLLALHTEHFLQASAIFSKATGHSAFRRQPLLAREKWRLFAEYLQYFLEIQSRHNPLLQTQARKIAAWRPASAELPREWRALQIQMDILHLMQALEKKNLPAVAEAVERFKPLQAKLKQDGALRTLYFIRALIPLVGDNGHLARGPIVEKNLKKMRAIPQSYQHLNGLEVAPYEKLWKIIESKLD